MERQGGHSQAGPSSNGRPMRKSSSAEVIRSSGKQHEAPKRPVNQPPNSLQKSGSGSQIASRQTAGTRTAGEALSWPCGDAGPMQANCQLGVGLARGPGRLAASLSGRVC